jgi:hypothetical protein
MVDLSTHKCKWPTVKVGLCDYHNAGLMEGAYMLRDDIKAPQVHPVAVCLLGL